MLDLEPHHEPLAALIADQLEQVAVIFERQLASELSSVNRLCMHVERYRGKMLRPSLVLLSGLAGASADELGDVLTEKHRIIAAVVEMIHMATLVHDDVLDGASVRRRGKTVNALWGNETAVMLGDYLLSNAFHLCSTAMDPAINLALGEVTNTLCEGELMQLHHRDDYSIDEPTYLEIINRKTASLIGACCRLGAQVSGRAEPTCDQLRRFGVHLGMAFQIQDDLLDLIGTPETVGKSLGMDLAAGMLTLPVIHRLEQADGGERGELLEMIEAGDEASLRQHLVEAGTIDSARASARSHVELAKRLISDQPETPGRALLLTLADHAISRSF